MVDSSLPHAGLSPEICVRALESRDARFDGLFFVGITSTRIYCRPICPARVSRPGNRRFFPSAATAERAGFRPCRRCRPELAPGRALVDAVSRLAHSAALRIASGALNGRSVNDLARELHVSERHLRRSLERELGVSPVELAQTHRLLLAKQLLTDSDLPVSRVAYASGFQSLRRFNVVFRERYGMNPTTLRRTPAARSRNGPRTACSSDEMLRLTLAYRSPFAWEGLLRFLRKDLIPGVELIRGATYMRTLQLDGHSGVLIAANRPRANNQQRRARDSCLAVDVSPSLVPVLMPLIARVRQLFDLDAEPAVIDQCLERAGLHDVVRQCPGLRVPGAIGGFEIGLGMLIRDGSPATPASSELVRSVVRYLGEPIDTPLPALDHLSPSVDRVADVKPGRLTTLGVPHERAGSIVALARAVTDGTITLEPGCDPLSTRDVLQGVTGICERLATLIVMRTLSWPDAFTSLDPRLTRAVDAGSPQDLEHRAEQWRPWRAYALLHLRLHGGAD